MKNLPRRIIIIGSICIALAALLLTTQKNATALEGVSQPVQFDWMSAGSANDVTFNLPDNSPQTLPPQGKQDPCLHCHIRGEEKGMFLFGGSTVIVIGESGRWLPESSIIENTDNGLETYLKLGQPLGKTNLGSV